MTVKWKDVKKDGKKLAAVMKFSKKEHTEENIKFLVAGTKGPKAKLAYEMYVEPGSKMEINIDSGLRDKCKDAYEKEDWKGLTKQLDVCKEQIEGLSQQILDRWEATGPPELS